nr:hypothetical protein CFP56_49590 [Quercus suber]
MDSYSITERRGRYHGSIRVGRSGLDWIITCLIELRSWDFSKHHFFKWFHENYKILECSSRLNKGGYFVEISEYHNGARRGCLHVPEGFHKGGWAFLERKLCDFFFGKQVSRPGKEVDAGGGRFAKPTGNPTNQVWTNINGHMKLGSDFDMEKQFPKLAGTLHQKEGFGGFDFIPKTNFSTHLVSGRPMRMSTLKWTKAHFSLNISVNLEGKGQRVVKWANFVQPKSVKDNITHAVLRLVKQTDGGPIKQAQGDFTGDKTHLNLKGLSKFCERGEGSGLQVSDEKSNVGSSEMGEEIPTFDGGSDAAVQLGFGQMGVSGEMGGAFFIFGEPDRVVQEAFDPTGCSSSGADVGATSVVSVASNSAMRCPISRVTEVLHGSSFGDHPRFSDTVAESTKVPVERAEVCCHQPLLEQNRFSPNSEMVSVSFDKETLLLNWENLIKLDRDEEEWQLMEYVPLAQWDPNGGLVLMNEEVDLVDISVEGDLEPSAWVSKKVKGFDKWVGFPIDSCERQCVEF